MVTRLLFTRRMVDDEGVERTVEAEAFVDHCPDNDPDVVGDNEYVQQLIDEGWCYVSHQDRWAGEW
jgi:hypothetical protein